MKNDNELNALFAEHVAKWRQPGIGMCFDRPDWTEDANAVLPWLEKASPVAICYAPPNEPYPLGRWEIAIKADGKHLLDCLSRADTFPRAAVIALLRAKGVEV